MQVRVRLKKRDRKSDGSRVGWGEVGIKARAKRRREDKQMRSGYRKRKGIGIGVWEEPRQYIGRVGVVRVVKDRERVQRLMSRGRKQGWGRVGRERDWTRLDYERWRWR